jgi:hypothetical protein
MAEKIFAHIGKIRIIVLILFICGSISLFSVVESKSIDVEGSGVFSHENNDSDTIIPQMNHPKSETDVYQGRVHGRVISLKALQREAKKSQDIGSYDEDIMKLCGIKRVLGYAIDKKNSDILLIGEYDEESPSLYLEDFVVALRNEWLLYAPLEGNTYYYSPAGCSIDPDPDVLNHLQQIMSQIAHINDLGTVEDYINQWNEVCSEPQNVRVIGVPFNTRFARVMVDADYYMKKIADGSVSLNVSGFKSMNDMILDDVSKDIQSGKPISIPLSVCSRFWFSPGNVDFREDGDIIYINESKVILLTEEEFLTKNGELAGTGKTNPYADIFAKSFSENFDKIDEMKPIFSELENLFRFITLAKLMKYRNSATEAGLNLDYLLFQFPVKNTSVNRTLSGISNIRRFQHRDESISTTSYLYMPSCGGVSMDINIKDDDFKKDVNKILKKEKNNIDNSIPTNDYLYFDIKLLAKRIDEFKRIYDNKKDSSGISDKCVMMLDEMDDSTLQINAIASDGLKTYDFIISSGLKEFIKTWNKMDSEKLKREHITDASNKNYVGELLSILEKMEEIAGGKMIILDAPQCRDYADLLNLYFAGNLLIATKHSEPWAIAETLNWNKQVKFKTSDIVVLYSADPKYEKAEQDARIKEWESWINEINGDLNNKITLKIVERPEEIYDTMNNIKEKGMVVIRVGETDADGNTIMPKGKFNYPDMEKNILDNPERVTASLNCESIPLGYADSSSKFGAGINIGTTRIIYDKEDVVEFLRLSTKRLEGNGGDLLDALQYAVNQRIEGQNQYFLKYASEYLKENPDNLEGAIDYAKSRTVELVKDSSSGIQVVIDSRGIPNLHSE